MTMQQSAQTIIEDSIRAVLPDVAVKRVLQNKQFPGNVYMVAIGKAAWRMAAAAGETLGEKMKAGIVITKYDHGEGSIPRVEVLEAGHPVPDENGVQASQKAIDLAVALQAEDTLIFLVSGGGSALFEHPLPGVRLEDIADITRQLLACGADIVEINTIRKHLSAVKGGRFASYCAPAQVLTIVLSDILGDPLDSIASGPSYPDASTSDDALAIIQKYALDIPAPIMEILKQETPKKLDNTENEITGNVTALCHAAEATAAKLGYRTLMLTTTLDTEARDAGAFLASIAREIKRSGNPIAPPCAVILGGETVVHVRGKGKGGRNQELALAAAKGIAGLSEVLIFSIGSDGTDGPTDAAGGMVTGAFAQCCQEAGLSIDAHLQNNDAYPILQKMGGLLTTGPTGTNVNDLTVLLCGVPGDGK